MKEHFSDNTYSLLKALYHTKIAMEYYEDVANGYEFAAKGIMLGYANKCKWILDNVRHRLPSDMLESIDKDMTDSLFIDAIEDKVIHFTQAQRDSLETIIDLMAKGELIEITDTRKEESH